jgi:hypothetical protein
MRPCQAACLDSPSKRSEVLYNDRMKIVGKRRTTEDLTPISPAEALARATVLQEQAELLNPFPRPRGFVYKARTREEYEKWRKSQRNPRLW